MVLFKIYKLILVNSKYGLLVRDRYCSYEKGVLWYVVLSSFLDGF